MKRFENYKPAWEVKFDISSKVEDLVGITIGVGERIHVKEFSDYSDRPNRCVRAEYLGIVLEEHPTWIRVLRKGYLQDYITTIHKGDLLASMTTFEYV